jgi:glutathione S-transferase
MKMFRVYGKSGAGSLVVEYLLALAGAEYELICLDKDVRDSDDFRRISPHGLIPALETPEGDAMCESLAITLYLLERFPEIDMIAPQGDPARMRCMQWLSILSTSLYNANLRVYYSDRFGPAPAVKSKAEADRRAVYDLIEPQMTPYLAGMKMSAADLYLFMLMQWDDGLATELEARPAMKRVMGEIAAMPAIREVMDRQP